MSPLARHPGSGEGGPDGADRDSATGLAAVESADRLPYLDGWRGLAVIALLAGHFLDVPGFNFGRVGVELFFVLSGRLMAEILFVRRQPIGEFFRRRVARLWPALAFYTVVTWAVLPPVGRLHATGPEALSVLTFSSNYLLPGGPTSVLGHTWSLCVEEHAYVILACLAVLARRVSGRVALIAMAVACAGMLNGVVRSGLFDAGYRAVYVKTDVRIASIFLGCAFYLLLRVSRISWPGYDSPIARRAATLLPLGFAAAGLLLNLKDVPDSIKYSAGSACLAVAVCTGDRLPRRARGLLGAPALTMAGTWSYSIYLWQQPFYKLSGQLIARLEDPLADAAVAGTLLALSLACGVASFYAVERPARRWLNARWAMNSPMDRSPRAI